MWGGRIVATKTCIKSWMMVAIRSAENSQTGPLEALKTMQQELIKTMQDTFTEYQNAQVDSSTKVQTLLVWNRNKERNSPDANYLKCSK